MSPLPPLDGRILEHEPLASRTTWRMGGPARWLAQPAHGEAAARFWGAIPKDYPRFILGGGSNILVADEGFSGIVLDLTHGVNRIFPPLPDPDLPEGDAVRITAEAGSPTRALAHFARRHGLGGAEFLSGIPGTLGGALTMNAGAFGREIKDILVEAHLLDPEGALHVMTPKDLEMGYRSTRSLPGWLVLAATFRFTPDHPDGIRTRMRLYNQQRRTAQPLNFPSAGSTFKNPPGTPPAWRLIENAGLRGTRVGDAQVSEKHCNFLINLGKAKAHEMRSLIQKVMDGVLTHCGIQLQPEVAYLGPMGVQTMDPV